MEEKVHEICSSLWTIFSFRHFNKSIFRRQDNSQSSSPIFLNKINGFTLIEILVVVALLGILAAGLISLINPAFQLQKSRDGRRKSDLEQIRSALELYRADCGMYPIAAASHALPSPLTNACTGSTVTYMQNTPVDPQSGGSYYYQNIPAGSSQGYEVSICLENGKDTGPDTFPHSVCPSGRAYKADNP